MQSIFRLPWCSEQITPKLAEKMSFDSLRATPVVEIPAFAKLKRKRTASPDSISLARMQSPKKSRADAALPSLGADRLSQIVNIPIPTIKNAMAETPAPGLCNRPASIGAEVQNATALPPVATPQHQATTEIMPATQDETDLSPLQQLIENQFNMQILMKHNELRLIEQELAKCQVALEQLRRCELRPFPGAEGLSLDVTTGTGPAVLPDAGFTRPSHPAPRGVVDGPYTRHYRQWLLPDTQFDSIPLSAASHFEQSAHNQARSTRNSGSIRKSFNKSFSLPGGRFVDSMAAMSSHPTPAPRDKSAPLILKRSTDNQMVKLICNNCLRGNFSSIQGFLNHCRIAHKVDYKSHDAAAIDCGRPLEAHEAAALTSDMTSAPPPKPTLANRSYSVAATPLHNPVHPMNVLGESRIPAAVPPQTTPNASRKPIASWASVPSTAHNGSLNRPFQASIQAPHLSAHFAKFKLGGNLQDAIVKAREKVDPAHFDDELLSPDISGPTSPSTFRSGEDAHDMPVAMSRSISRKGHRESSQRPRPSPLMPVSKPVVTHAFDSPVQTPNLSPHAAESNPGLVSDHEDDDHASGSEDESPRSAGMAHALPVRRDCSDHMDIDVTVDDSMDEHGVVIRRNSMFAADARALGTAAGSPPRPHVARKP